MHSRSGFPDSFGLFGEYGRGKGLGEEEERNDLDTDCEDGGAEEDPAPIRSGRDVRTTYRCYARREPGEDAVDSLALAALFFGPCIC